MFDNDFGLLLMSSDAVVIVVCKSSRFAVSTLYVTDNTPIYCSLCSDFARKDFKILSFTIVYNNRLWLLHIFNYDVGLTFAWQRSVATVGSVSSRFDLTFKSF